MSPGKTRFSPVGGCSADLRWGNQYRQLERNNTLRPVLEAVIERWKRENRHKQDAIVEENEDPMSKVPLPASTS